MSKNKIVSIEYDLEGRYQKAESIEALGVLCDKIIPMKLKYNFAELE